MKKIYIKGNLTVNGAINAFGILTCCQQINKVDDFFIVFGDVHINGNFVVGKDCEVVVLGSISCTK